MTNKYLFIVTVVTLLTSACTSKNIQSNAEFPGTREDQRRERVGKLGGEDGLIKFGGRSKEEDEGRGNTGIGINSYLWRSTLDTLSFMPLISADPFGGVVITDWYEDPQARGERFKITVVILSKTLRSDAVKVSVFKQQRSDTSTWQDATASQTLARDLENKILTRARQLRLKKE